MNVQYKFFRKEKRRFVKPQTEMLNKVIDTYMGTLTMKVQQRIFQSCHSKKRKQWHKTQFSRSSLEKSQSEIIRLDDVIQSCAGIQIEQ